MTDAPANVTESASEALERAMTEMQPLHDLVAQLAEKTIGQVEPVTGTGPNVNGTLHGQAERLIFRLRVATQLLDRCVKAV